MTRAARWGLTTATMVLVAACSRPGDYRAALVLTDDASKRCDENLSAIAYLWKDFGVEVVEDYYATTSDNTMKPIDVRLGQARAVLGKLSKGQERDLLFEHYASVDKLCGLVRSVDGYNLITLSMRRTELADEMADTRAKLRVLVPVTDGERSAILTENAGPVDEAERLAKGKDLHSKRAEAAVAIADAQRRQQEADDAARRAAERKAFDEAESARLERENAAALAAAVDRRRQQEAAAQDRADDRQRKADQALTAAEHQKSERQAYLARTRADAQAWFNRSYADADRFCTTANQFSQDLQASRFARASECSTVQQGVGILRERLAGGPPEIAALNQSILDSYGRGATACLRRGDLVAVSAFNEGQRACSMLRYRLREYGILEN